MAQSENILMRVERIKLMRDLALMDAPGETIYDRFTQMAGEVLNTPVSLVSMVAAGYQIFKSMYGVPEQTAMKAPISKSICRHVVASDHSLIVSDMHKVEALQHEDAVVTGGLRSYLGMPLRLADGNVMGSFCVMDMQAHEWTDIDVAIMTHLADIISYEFDLRAQARINLDAKHRLSQLHQAVEALFREYVQQAPVEKPDFLTWIEDWREQFSI